MYKKNYQHNLLKHRREEFETNTNFESKLRMMNEIRQQQPNYQQPTYEQESFEITNKTHQDLETLINFQSQRNVRNLKQQENHRDIESQISNDFDSRILPNDVFEDKKPVVGEYYLRISCQMERIKSVSLSLLYFSAQCSLCKKQNIIKMKRQEGQEKLIGTQKCCDKLIIQMNKGSTKSQKYIQFGKLELKSILKLQIRKIGFKIECECFAIYQQSQFVYIECDSFSKNNCFIDPDQQSQLCQNCLMEAIFIPQKYQLIEIK